MPCMPLCLVTLVTVLCLTAAVPLGAQSSAPAETPEPAQAKPADKPPAQVAPETAPKPWYERVRFSGDFRSRYEGFYQEDRETRNRVRLRMRLRLDTAVNEDMRFQLQ